MEIECPHCFTFVFVREDGQCPSCRQDTNDVRGLDRDLATVVVGENSPIPEVCCGCGLPTRRSVCIKQWKPVAGDISAMTGDAETSAVFVALYVMFGWIGGLLFKALWKSSSHDRQSVRVPIVQCDACSSDGPPSPLRVDYENFTMRFVVHRNFKSRYEELVR
jgi:hypothetical protein